MSGNPESILDSVKQTLGLDADYVEFDVDVVMHINSAFMSLQQLGVGPKTGFTIADNTLTWADYSPDMVLLAGIKSYLYLKVRMIFDPPATSFVINAMEKQIEELEFRLNVGTEQIYPPNSPPVDTVPPWGYWSPYYDFVYGDVFSQGVMWDLTYLSDFPTEAAVGDFGINLLTGDVWRKEA